MMVPVVKCYMVASAAHNICICSLVPCGGSVLYDGVCGPLSCDGICGAIPYVGICAVISITQYHVMVCTAQIQSGIQFNTV